MANNQSNLGFYRDRFKFVNGAFAGTGLNASPSKIRIEKKLKNGVGQYQFDITKSDPTNFRETVLRRNDLFIPTYIGVLLGIAPVKHAEKMMLVGYPKIGDIKAGHIGFKTDDIKSLYNGYLSWQIGNTKVFESCPTENFMHIPETQQVKIGDGTVDAGLQNQFDILDNLMPMVPEVAVAGNQTHKIEVDFEGNGLDFGCVAPQTELINGEYESYLVLYMDGYLVIDGAQFADKDNPFKLAVGNYMD